MQLLDPQDTVDRPPSVAASGVPPSLDPLPPDIDDDNDDVA